VTRHPDAGVLAECREGLLGRRRAARVRAHLASCPHCASLDAGLAEVGELLASSPAPSMPDHLIARLDRALAAEAASRPAAVQADGDDTASRVPGGTAPEPDGQPGSSPRPGHGWRPGRRPAGARRPARLRPAMLGAAAMIVLAGAGYGLASLTQGGTSASAGSPGRGSTESPHSGAMNPPESPGKSQHPGGSPNQPALGPAIVKPWAPLRVIDSGTDYQPGALASQAGAVLAGLATYGGYRQLPASQAMRTCVTEITGGKTGRLVDETHYRGHPATIIVQAPSARQPGKVWVTRPACSALHHEVLQHASLPSPG
jgi:hypothetical protein